MCSQNVSSTTIRFVILASEFGFEYGLAGLRLGLGLACSGLRLGSFVTGSLGDASKIPHGDIILT